MSKGDAASTDSGIAFSSVSVDGITDNTSQHLIYITEDKLEICIRDFKKSLAKELTVGTPLGIAITLVATVLTVQFTDVGSIPALALKTIFIMATIASVLWLLYAGFQLYNKPATSPADFIKMVKSKRTQV